MITLATITVEEACAKRDSEVSASTAAKSLITISAINHPIGDDGNLSDASANARDVNTMQRRSPAGNNRVDARRGARFFSS